VNSPEWEVLSGAKKRLLQKQIYFALQQPFSD
jgi:hypothetical protein